MSQIQIKKNIIDDFVFGTELVKQFGVGIDYIFALISKPLIYQNKELLTTITKIVNSSYELRSKKELIMNFIKTIYAEKNKFW